MPKVQSYGGRRVQRQGLPSAMSGAAPTAESLGAGLARAQIGQGEALAQVGSTLANVGNEWARRTLARDRQRADELAELEAEREIGEWTNQRLYDPDSGALNVRGKAAFALPETVMAEYDAFTGEIAKRMKTPEQQIAFNRTRYSRQLSLDRTIRQHTFEEIQRHEGTELSKFIENETADAIANALDPAVVGEKLANVVDKIKRHAPRAGFGPEQVEAAVRGVQTEVHVGVVERLLDNGEDRKAQAYYDEANVDISGKVRGNVERALEAGSIKGESQRQADAITLAGGTLSERRAKAKAIDDPKVREETLRLVEHEAIVQEREQREREETTLRGAYDVVDKTRSIKGIPASVWASMDGSDRSAVRHYAKLVADVGTAGAVQTDHSTFYTLITMASANPNEFAKLNLLRYKNVLSMSDFQEFARMQKSVREGDSKGASSVFVSERAQGEMVDEALSRMGIDLTPAQQQKQPAAAQRITAFRRSVREAVTRLEQSKGGKQATDTEVQSIVDTLSAETGRRMVRDGWFYNTYEPARAFETAQAKVTAVDQIPASEQRAIERALRNKGIQPTPDKMILLFNQRLSSVRKDR